MSSDITAPSHKPSGFHITLVYASGRGWIPAFAGMTLFRRLLAIFRGMTGLHTPFSSLLNELAQRADQGVGLLGGADRGTDVVFEALVPEEPKEDAPAG